MNTPLARNLRRERLSRNWSQEGLGELTGVSGAAVGNWERSTRIPRERYLARLNAVLGVNLELDQN